VPNAMGSSLRLYGNYLVEAEAGEPRPSYDANVPWISSTSDVNSPEWAQAAQVRRAMSIAIDREALVETIFSGFAQPIAMGFWGLAHNHQLEGRMWEFDPDLAMELLADAGYGDGFPINLTTAVRAAPGEIEACEAVGTMWSNIGIDVRFQRIPYTTLRPQLVGRTYQGATCHASSERFVVGAIPQITTEASFNHGATHPFLEEIMPRIEGAVDPQERIRLEAEMGQWLFDHAYTNIGLYVVDAVWPAGARIEPWTEHAKTRDLRNITGYEFIRHKQE
jgi:ABC-type transport system substrate-binding protein